MLSGLFLDRIGDCAGQINLAPSTTGYLSQKTIFLHDFNGFAIGRIGCFQLLFCPAYRYIWINEKLIDEIGSFMKTQKLAEGKISQEYLLRLRLISRTVPILTGQGQSARAGAGRFEQQGLVEV